MPFSYEELESYLVNNCGCSVYKPIPRPYQLEEDVADMFVTPDGFTFSVPQGDVEGGYYSDNLAAIIMARNDLTVKSAFVKQSNLPQ